MKTNTNFKFYLKICKHVDNTVDTFMVSKGKFSRANSYFKGFFIYVPLNTKRNGADKIGCVLTSAVFTFESEFLGKLQASNL